jgi:hypothetical protein
VPIRSGLNLSLGARIPRSQSPKWAFKPIRSAILSQRSGKNQVEKENEQRFFIKSNRGRFPGRDYEIASYLLSVI